MARLASRDIRSDFGSNVKLLQEETGLDPWVSTPLEMKRKLRELSIPDIPEGDRWRIDYLVKLLNARQLAYFECNTDEYERNTSLIESLVVN